MSLMKVSDTEPSAEEATMISATGSSQRLAMLSLQAMLVTTVLAGCTSTSRLAGNARADKDGASLLTAKESATSSTSVAHNQFVETPGHASDMHNLGPEPSSTSAVSVARASNQNPHFQLVSGRSSVPPLSTLQAHESLDARLAAAPGVVLIDFYADWCGPCRKQGKILHELETEAARQNATMIKVDIEAHPQLAERYKATRLPTLIAVRNGQVVQRHTGLATAEQVTAMLQN